MPSAMRSTGTYVDAKTGKKTVVGPRPLRNALKRPLFLIPLLILVAVAGAQDQRDIRVRAKQEGAYSVSPGTGAYPSAQSGPWSVSPGTGTFSISIDNITTGDDGAPGADPYLHMEMYDAQEDKEVQVTPIKELRVVTGFRLVGATFINGFFDNNFWSSTTINNGMVTVSSGSVQIYGSSGTTTNGAAYVQTLRVARFVSGSANEFRGILRFSTNTITTGTTDMRWGLSDAVTASTTTLRNGFYFRYANNAFYVGYRLAGVETNVSTDSFNGTVPTINNRYHRYQIVYTNIGASFYVDDILVHKLSATTAALTETVNFRARAQVVNSGGGNSQNELEARVLTILRLGAESTMPLKRHIATGTAASVYKYGPGYLHHISVNDAGAAASSITIYDSTYTATTEIIAVVNTSKTSVGNINYDLPFDKGLYIAPTGTFGDITVVYE